MSLFSYTVTSYPRSASSCAALNPATPPPSTATLLGIVIVYLLKSRANPSAECPYQSITALRWTHMACQAPLAPLAAPLALLALAADPELTSHTRTSTKVIEQMS